MPIFKRLLGNFLIFTTFPPEDSLGLFVCYEGHIQDVKTAEIVFVAICSRSYHKMPVLRTIVYVQLFWYNNNMLLFSRPQLTSYLGDMLLIYVCQCDDYEEN